MTKTFQKNKDGKIEFTVEQLKNLLDEIYWQGYNDNSTYTYSTPYFSTTTTTVPNWYVTTAASTADDTITFTLGHDN